MTPKSKLFIYGTLKDSRKSDDCWVLGKLWDTGSFPAVTLNGDLKIEGQAVWVTDRELKELDRYECVPSLYRRTMVNVLNEYSESPAWIYEWSGSTERLTEIRRWHG